MDGGGAGGGQSLGERGGSLVWGWQEQVREPPRVGGSERVSPEEKPQEAQMGCGEVLRTRVSLR